MVMKLPAAGSDGGPSHFRTLSQYYFRISWHTRQDIKLFYISVLLSVSSALTSYERYANRVMIQSKRKEKKRPPVTINQLNGRTNRREEEKGGRSNSIEEMNWIPNELTPTLGLCFLPTDFHFSPFVWFLEVLLLTFTADFLFDKRSLCLVSSSSKQKIEIKTFSFSTSSFGGGWRISASFTNPGIDAP